MKIAFVGKGGSGKTTMSVLFSQYASIEHKVLTIDADINMHTASELGVNTDEIKILSDKETSLEIRRLLIGDNKRIESVSHFRKSTPPARGSTTMYLLKNIQSKSIKIFTSVLLARILNRAFHQAVIIII